MWFVGSFGGWTADGWCVEKTNNVKDSTKHPQIAPGSSPGPSKNHGWGGVESSTSMDGVWDWVVGLTEDG